jgi:hypothetical protein
LLHQGSEGISGLLHNKAPRKYLLPYLDYNMNPKEEYPFAKEFFVNDKFYLNKYTE